MLIIKSSTVLVCILKYKLFYYKIIYLLIININFFIGRNKGSPIRIFTNVDQFKIPLPVEENYKFCDVCNRWVCSENVHCYKCNNCTSKVIMFYNVH